MTLKFRPVQQALQIKLSWQQSNIPNLVFQHHWQPSNAIREIGCSRFCGQWHGPVVGTPLGDKHTVGLSWIWDLDFGVYSTVAATCRLKCVTQDSPCIKVLISGSNLAHTPPPSLQCPSSINVFKVIHCETQGEWKESTAFLAEQEFDLIKLWLYFVQFPS